MSVTFSPAALDTYGSCMLAFSFLSSSVLFLMWPSFHRWFYFYLLNFLPSLEGIFFIAFRESRGWEEKYWCEKHQLVAFSYTPDQGLNPQPGYVPWLRIKLTTFGPWDSAPTNWDTLARAGLIFSFTFISCAVLYLITFYCVVYFHWAIVLLLWVIVL